MPAMGPLHVQKPLASVYLNNPPNPPVIEGCSVCTIYKEYTYNITISDPDGNRLMELYVVFGDGTNLTLKHEMTSSCKKGWRSGMTLEVDHIWKKQGNYSMKAKVKEYLGYWGDWGYYDVQTSFNIPQISTMNLNHENQYNVVK